MGFSNFDVRRFDCSSYDALCRSFVWELPEYFNMGSEMLDKHADTSKVAMYYEGSDGSTRMYRFRDLLNMSNRLANTLTDLKVGRGDRIAILVPQGPEALVAMLTAYRIGAIALSMSTLFGTDAIKYRLADSGAKVFIFDDTLRDKVRPALDGLSIEVFSVHNSGSGEFNDIDSILRHGSTNFKPVHTRIGDPAHMLYTSGTTGLPKGVLLPHSFLLGCIPCYQLYLEMAPREGDVFWTPSEWAWVAAIGDVLFPSLYFGYPVVVTPRSGKFDPAWAYSIMERYRVTCAYIVPTALRMMRRFKDEPRKEYDLALRALGSAGEPVGAELVRWCMDRLNVPLNEIYGQTEANIVVTNCYSLMGPKPGSIGKATPGFIVEVLDENGNIAKPNEIGEIAVKMPNPVAFIGYWNRPEDTSRKVRNGWLYTGDNGYKDAEGFIWFVARTDDIIKAAGYRIGPAEVEEAINQHPAVLESAVVPWHDEIRGHVIKAYVVLKPGYEPSEALKEEIQQSVRKRLAEYAYPRLIEFINELPKTDTGKIKRKELRSMHN
ncbi:MAG: AMP-binding protein [Candidatus Nitrosocaldus sp.]|nr:AMP-binding protein [Candidatus Nitrosocaldus sp.]MDW8276175.1 AMP-binding protein [Candidatus Nitrosocaldus sp.]